MFGHYHYVNWARTTFLPLHRRSSTCVHWGIPPLRQSYSASKFPIVYSTTAMATVDLSHYDPEQAKLMKERCILVNEKDESLGAVDKKDCKLFTMP